MAEMAYELQRFEARPKTEEKAPRVRVVKTPAKKQRRKQALRYAKLVLLCGMVVVLVCGVLRTQARMTELQGAITSTQKQIEEEQALNTHLRGQLDSMVNLRNIEEKAKELGLVKMDSSKVNYIRVEDGSSIEVRKGAFATLVDNVKNGIASLFGGDTGE